MSFVYIQYVFLILISINCVFGIIKLPLCQCECCPGHECLPQLLVYSVENCNETTCSFEQCYAMYPKKCGLIPGFTNPFCNIRNYTKINSSIIPIPRSTSASSSSSSNIIFPIMIVLSCILNFFFF